jgi:hypothetical protein
MKNLLNFSCVHNQNFLNKFLSRVGRISLSKSEGKKKTNWSLSLAKPLKFLKPKPPLQNQPSTELQAVVFFLSKTLPFQSKGHD